MNLATLLPFRLRHRPFDAPADPPYLDGLTFKQWYEQEPAYQPDNAPLMPPDLDHIDRGHPGCSCALDICVGADCDLCCRVPGCVLDEVPRPDQCTYFLGCPRFATHDGRCDEHQRGRRG